MMCDPLREHRFRSCHTIYSVHLSMGYILAWRALSWCRRTSVRPPDDIEKSVTQKLHWTMPLSGKFAIQATSLHQSSLNLHFLFGAIFSTGASPSHIPRAIHRENNMENSARKLSEERWRLSNRNPPPMVRH